MSEAAAERLRLMGVELRLNEFVADVADGEVVLSGTDTESESDVEPAFVAAAAFGFSGHLAVIAVSRNAPAAAEMLVGGLDRNTIFMPSTPRSASSSCTR
ncbi:MAG: hypothetical protein AAGJ46_15540 [Planctomycetota bacterium]